MIGFSKTYELPIAKTYVRHLGVVEAVREIIQNALDSDSPFEYQFSDDSLTVFSRNSTLSPSTLLLGCTSKADQANKIGSFGEGYKIAMLVLAREGYDVTLRNGDRDWVPEFRHSNTFQADVLCIKDSPAAQKNEGLAFVVQGITPSEEGMIRESCLQMQNVGEVIQTSMGRILRDRPGKLYVGGLFICDTGLQFGYDIRPEFITLERDRQTVSSFEIKWSAKAMWFETGLFDEIAALIDAKCPDLDHADAGAPELVKEACYKRFKEKHPGAVIVNSQEEMEALVAKGMTKTIYHSSPTYTVLVSSAREYREEAVIPQATPSEILAKWFSDNRQHMRKDALVSFKKLVVDAVNWRAK